ncbi:MAG: dimethyl sulfoxide reductase anchor subunit [Betaproteobacteria bacterium]|nr:dimethyl sulfoxide reductase anchor subunit [Betaproteobacteria bacterium]
MSGAHYGPKPWVQQHWDIRAATNFMLGGTGSGFIVAWALAGLSAPVNLLWLVGGLALIGAGLGAVWLEIGRKLRAVHVFFNPWTSWMTRESFAALVLFAFGGATLVWPALAPATALAALVFVWCQGRILHASKGIPAWRQAEIVALTLATALAEGAGLFLIVAGSFETGSPRSLLALFVIALVARALAWARYRAALARNAPKPVAAVLEAPGKAMLQIGAVAPLVLLFAGMLLPAAAPACAILAGIVALLPGWRFKFVLVTRAALNQGFALPKLPVRGTR